MKDLCLLYDYCKFILREYVDKDIPLVVTNAKTYMGRIYFVGNKPIKIMLSKFNLYVSSWDDDDIEDALDTICHEFAHINFFEHGENHSKLTSLYKQLCYLYMDDIKNLLEYE